MGYFSEKHLTQKESYTDPSYYSFEEQLLLRYEELKERYLELLEADAPHHGNILFAENDYRYAPINHFKALHDIWRAIEIAKDDLEKKCDITLPDDKLPRAEDVEDEGEADSSVFEIILLPTWFLTAAAA